MNRLQNIVAGVSALTAVLALCGFTSGYSPALEVPVIVTAAPAYEPLAALRGKERFPQGAQLLLLTHGAAQPLVPSFAATADANVSFDAKTILFAGKKVLGDKWAVWEMTLADASVRLVVKGATDLIRPLYLPGGRLVYARDREHGFQLETIQLDGSGALPLSYVRASAVPQDVLADGRILFSAGFPLGIGLAQGAKPEMFLVYSDGSGVESYRCDHGRARWGGRQLSTGDVVFTHGHALARFTSRLATEAPIIAPRAEFTGDIAETSATAWLISAREKAGIPFALNLWKPGTAAMQAIYVHKKMDIVEPVLVTPRDRPKRHPSGLHDWNYANLLALDARQSRDGALTAAPSSVRLEAMDEGGEAVALGTSPVEADGSFFVKVPADKPIRFVLLDGHGAVIRQERGWFWIRRGEQRICVGCHVGPEHAAENRVPAVLLRTTTPVDLTGAAQVKSGAPSMQGGR